VLERRTVVVHSQEDLPGAGLAQAGLVEDPQAGFSQLDLLAQEPAVGRLVGRPLAEVVALPDQTASQWQCEIQFTGNEADLLRAVNRGPGRASTDFELVEAGHRGSVANQDVRLLARDEPRMDHPAVAEVVVGEEHDRDVGAELQSEGIVASHGRLDADDGEEHQGEE